VRITLDKRNGRLEASVSVDLLEKVRLMPGRKRWDNDVRPPVLLFEPSEANISFLRANYPGAEWRDNTNVLEAIDALHAQAMDLSKPQARPVMPTDYRFKTQPFDHQLRAFMISRDALAYALLMEAGTGKTKVVIDTAAWLWGQGKIDGMLILAPNGVHRQWVEEQIPLHLPDWVTRDCHAHKVGRPDTALFEASPKLRVLTMNLEAVNTAAGRDLAERFLRSGRIMMVVDESHRIKNPSAKSTRAIIRLGHLASHRRICTGTPIAKGMEDQFSQFFFLSPHILGYNSFTSFRNQHCVMGGYENRKIIGYRNMEGFQARIRPYAYRVLKKDCLDLPPKIGGIDNPNGPLKRYVELTPEQRRHYNAIRDELITFLSDGSAVEAPLAVQKLVRLQQILCGHLPREDGSLEIIPSNRVRVCEDIVADATGKVVIWTRFRHDVDALVAAFGDRAVTVQGGQEAINAQSIKLFMDPNSGKDILVANQQAGGTGLNLAGLTSDIIYYSNSFNSLDRWQSEDRTYRIGTHFAPRYIDLVCRGTIDPAIIANLRRKRSISDLTLGELEAMVRGGGA
jgi:hypothetical protein